MKAYTLDLRERVVGFLQAGGSKVEAGRRFELGRSTVYRYLAAVKTNTLAPKTSWGSWRKLDPAKLHAHVKKHPDATLAELQKIFAVSHHAVWTRLNQLGFTLKKTHKISRAERGAAVRRTTITLPRGRQLELPSGGRGVGGMTRRPGGQPVQTAGA